VEAGETRLLEENGVFYRDGQPYSGFIRETYDGRTVKLVSVYLGMRHGLTTTFYPDGNLRDVRSYRDNVGYGRHYGYWENGTMKFDYQYIDDRREGVQKQWYRSGKPYAFLTFQDDREVGMQQAWRESGRLYINYEVRDGIRYGLQKSVLCSEIEVGETT
jgi:antitoxin component YwqK of YwqJK toxin-antitoxin module